MSRIKNDDVFGWWTVVEYRSGKSLCRCSCGTDVLVFNHNLRNGTSTKCKSCGTTITANNRIRTPTRKVLRHLPNKVYMRLFWAADSAIARCTNEALDHWKDYGGRGIKVCQEWMLDKFKFIEHLATLPGFDNPDLVLDRIENDGDYAPGNLRFVTRSQSSYNRRRFGHLQEHGRDGRFTTKER